MNVQTHNVIILELRIELIVSQVIRLTQEHKSQLFLPSLDDSLYLLLFVCILTVGIVLLQ